MPTLTEEPRTHEDYEDYVRCRDLIARSCRISGILKVWGIKPDHITEKRAWAQVADGSVS